MPVENLSIRSSLTLALALAICSPVHAQSAAPVEGDHKTEGKTMEGMNGQAGQAPMTNMQTGRPASQAASMTEMMGAPGLVPFDIMTGRAGQWMVGYQFMTEKLDGNLSGTDHISLAKILERYSAAPTDMTMDMHMGMIMYAPTDRFTLMAMLPYVTMSMGELQRDGTRGTERSKGVGDLELRGLYSLYATTDLRHRILATFGVGLPTGSVSQRDPEGMRMEYPMQTGSGTYSLLPGFAYLGQALPWGWAADAGATVRLGRNDIGYRLGNRYQTSVSITRELTNWMSVSTGARGELWKNISGSDPLLDPTTEPTKDTNAQGGKRLSVLLGITFHPQQGFLKGQHFHILGEVPVVQSLDGPQLQRSWVIRFGWQLEF